jgi:NarL family two-component system response regulator LiaR
VGYWYRRPLCGPHANQLALKKLSWSIQHQSRISSTIGPSTDKGWTRAPVKKQILIYALLYGLGGGLFIVLLKLFEYRFLVVEHSVEIYGGLIALVFAILGIWLGLKLTRKKETIVVKEIAVPAAQTFTLNEGSLRDLGVTKRELEILALIAKGMSNREIAESLFVSENTVKTHSSRLFDKIGARRRTQAVQMGKELGLIP